MIDRIKYRLQEYADNPLTFDKVPEWLQGFIDDKRIVPVFGGEDYWYLEVDTDNKGLVTIGPDDFIIYEDGKLKVETGRWNG